MSTPAVPERVTNTYERKIAANPSRRGREWAFEGLTQKPEDVAARFLTGIANDSYTGATGNFERPGTVYQAQQAQPSYIGRVDPSPNWTDEGAYMAAFAEGTIRARSERRYGSKVAPAKGGRGVRNHAQVG